MTPTNVKDVCYIANYTSSHMLNSLKICFILYLNRKCYRTKNLNAICRKKLQKIFREQF